MGSSDPFEVLFEFEFVLPFEVDDELREEDTAEREDVAEVREVDGVGERSVDETVVREVDAVVFIIV